MMVALISMVWDTVQAEKYYHTREWGEGYFAINANGDVCVSPHAQAANIPLKKIVEAAMARGLQLPLLLRFDDILTHRATTLQQAFTDAIKMVSYQGSYQLVYPIKVNQQASVINKLLAANVGLEAGSKAELLAAIGLQSVPRFILCNGYKDANSVELALLAQQLGHHVIIIIEKLSELELVLAQASEMKIKPRLGLRIRLTSAGVGKWQNSGGIKSKFGLDAEQVLQALQQLKQHQQLDHLQLLHFHLGSQVPEIEAISKAVQEAVRYYHECVKLGACITQLDVGGGLAVDYEGMQSQSNCSMNYTVDQYATAIVQCVKSYCQEYQLAEPDLISESGRAMTAHHAVLVTNVIACEDAANNSLPENDYQKFVTGAVDLTEWVKRHQAHCVSSQKTDSPNCDSKGNHSIANNTRLFTNFSLFKSLPDIWAFNQIFPILPLTQCDQPPTMQATICDMTCDSDGQIDHYCYEQALHSHLALPNYCAEKPYLLGFFLVGAYQEILGDIHNLFGTPNAVHVSCDSQGQWHFNHASRGDVIADMLEAVSIEPEKILNNFREQVASTDYSLNEKHVLLQLIQQQFDSHTYLEQLK